MYGITNRLFPGKHQLKCPIRPAPYPGWPCVPCRAWVSSSSGGCSRNFHRRKKFFRPAYDQLVQVKGVSPTLAQAIKNFKDWPRWDAALERLLKLGGEVITCADPRFPAALKQIPYAPPFLYVKGTLLPQDEMAVAVVGTRKPSYYGRKASYRLASDLCRHQVTVVSGLARGIDTAAHQAAVDCGGRTLAVLGLWPGCVSILLKIKIYIKKLLDMGP